MNNKNILAVLKTKAEEIENGTLSAAKEKHLAAVKTEFEVIDRQASTQGYVTVVNKKTGRSLVISTGYDGRSYFYGTQRAVEAEGTLNEVAKVFDFYGYLTTDLKRNKFEDNRLPEVKRVEEFITAKNRKNMAEKRAAQLRKEIEEKMELLKSYEDDAAGSEKRMQAVLRK